LRATKENLRKAADALGLSWDAEQAQVSAVTISQLVRDGKLLYQIGKLDEAELKLQEALAGDPNNQAALYYLNLIKQSRTRGSDTARGARARNVPGPGPRPDNIWISDAEPKLPAPNPHARTNRIFTSSAREKIYKKLNDIRFDKIAFPDMRLSDVILELAEQTQRRDVDQEGINYILNKTKQPTAETAPSINTQTGEDVDLAAVKISLNTPARNVRLLDLLEAITKSSDHPISYSVVDYGVEFNLKDTNQVQLHTRTFKVDPNSFYMGLRKFAPNLAAGSDADNGNAGGIQGSGSRHVREMQLAVIKFFAEIGVNLAAPKSVFFKDSQGTLTVRATDEDLELIEKTINLLNAPPPEISGNATSTEPKPPIPEVMVKARFVELNKKFLKALSTNGVGVPTNTSPNRILSEEQFNPILKMLQKKEYGDLLNEGQVTTLSGRQAIFQVMDVLTIVLNNTNKTPPFDTKMSPFGTTLDVMPQVAADGRTIELKTIPSVTEFLGYEDVKTGKLFKSPFDSKQVVVPKSRMRRTAMDAMVSDGETLLLTDFGDEWVSTSPDGIEQRKSFNDKSDRQLVVFITATIIDKAGNRVNAGRSSTLVSPPAR